MSQWTHVSGVIRFDSLNKNIWPIPRNADKKVAEEADFVHDMLQRNCPPTGSEGGIRIDTIITDRGPTVVLTADLRDFGAGDVESIRKWVEERISAIADESKKYRMPIHVRDIWINCDVEFDDNLYIILKGENEIILRIISALGKDES